MSKYIKDEDMIDNHINKEYLRKEGLKLFKLDVLPPALKHYLPKEEQEKVTEFIQKCRDNKTEKPDYYKYRCKTYSNTIEHNVEYEWKTLLNYIKEHPEHSKLLKGGK